MESINRPWSHMASNWHPTGEAFSITLLTASRSPPMQMGWVSAGGPTPQPPNKELLTGNIPMRIVENFLYISALE